MSHIRGPPRGPSGPHPGVAATGTMCASRPPPQGHAAVDGHPESETVCPGPVRGLPAVPREHPVALAAEVARPPLIQIHYGLPLPRLEGHLITARISPCSRSQSMSVVATHRVRKPSCQSRSQRQSATGRTPQSHVSSPARRRCGISPPSACSRSSSPPPSARRGPSGGACRPTRARTRIPSSPARTPGCGRKRVLQALWSLARARRGCRAPRRTAGRGPSPVLPAEVSAQSRRVLTEDPNLVLQLLHASLGPLHGFESERLANYRFPLSHDKVLPRFEFRFEGANLLTTGMIRPIQSNRALE